MAQFNKDKFEIFLGSVRKYMQVRGPYSQKELAEMAGIGESTLSRFMSMKTQDINAQLVAKLVARLNIPMHEIIDFVEEDFTEQFTRLVKFYKGEDPVAQDIIRDQSEGGTAQKTVSAKVSVGGKTHTITYPKEGEVGEDPFENLSAYQRAFMNNFLGLDSDRRDLIVDIGNNLIRYFQKKGIIP